MSSWRSKKKSNGEVVHFPIERRSKKRVTTKDLALKEKENKVKRVLDQKLENLDWYTDTEYGYLDEGVDEAKVYRTGIDYKGKFYEITVYPMELIDKDLLGWEYKIYTLNKNGEIIDEYNSAFYSEGRYFPTLTEAKKASISTLREMLEG